MRDLADAEHARAGAPPGADDAVLLLALEAQHVAALGAQQQRHLLRDAREEDRRVRLGGDARRHPLQRHLLARERARLLRAAPQRERVAGLLDREPREVDRAVDDELVAGLRQALGAVVQGERPEHLAAARQDRRRPAGAQAVLGRELDERRRQRIGGDVEHDDRLAAVGGGAADALAFADRQAVDGAGERARQARAGGVAQDAAPAAPAVDQQNRGEHAGRVRLGDVQELRQRLLQRRARRDQLEHRLLAVAPAPLALGHRARDAQFELRRRRDRELLDEVGVMRGPGARQRVGDAEAAQDVPGTVDQRRADERGEAVVAVQRAVGVIDRLQRARRDDALAQRAQGGRIGQCVRGRRRSSPADHRR